MHKAHATAAFALAVTAVSMLPVGVAGEAWAHTCPSPRADYHELASKAYIWGYPLIRSAQLRQNMTLPEDPFRARSASAAGAALNRLGHARELATSETRHGVAPNNDTLYSLAWLDTDSGAFVFEAPDFGDRYYTFQMGQADTTTDVALGKRTHGGQLPPIFIQGPRHRYEVPAGMLEVRSTQRYLMIAGRTLVQDNADLIAAHRLQDGMRLRHWSDYQAGRDAAPQVTAQHPIERRDPPAEDAAAFLRMLGAVLVDWHSSPDEIGFVRSLAPLGLATGRHFDPKCLGPQQLAAIAQGLQDGRTAITERTLALGADVNGWTVNYLGSQFGTDMLLRAAVAMDQIYVLPADEALYMNAKRNADGEVLDGRSSYVLRFSREQLPPVRYFWSVTMYFAKGFLVPNEIDRYSIGNRTPGLIRGSDGSIEILLQHERPAALDQVNWLPAPDEPFALMLRLYGPSPEVQDREWRPPALVEVESR